MSVSIFTPNDPGNDQAVMVCNTEGRAFGPVFDATDHADAAAILAKFIEWLPRDPREYAPSQLVVLRDEFTFEMETTRSELWHWERGN